MIHEYKFNTNEEKESILNNNKDKFFYGEYYLITGKYIAFTDDISEVPKQEISIDEIVKEQGNKISILEEENETLKIELSITQDAVNELLFNTLNA